MKEKTPESLSQEEPVSASHLPEETPGALPYPVQEAVTRVTFTVGTALFWAVLVTPITLSLLVGYAIFGWGVLPLVGGILASIAVLMKNTSHRGTGGRWLGLNE
jgi:hypothetical protein